MNNLLESPAALIIFITTIGLSLYAMFRDQRLYYSWILHPYSVIREKRYYTMVTSGFLHADLMHLMFNMLTFYFFAFNLELIVGSWRFLIIYFGCLVLSDISTVIKKKDDPDYRAVGASGAIAGVLFSFILFFPTQSIYLMFIPIPIPAPVFALLYLGYTYYASKKINNFINHEAHLWGALTGIALTIIMIPGVAPHFINTVIGYFS